MHENCFNSDWLRAVQFIENSGAKKKGKHACVIAFLALFVSKFSGRECLRTPIRANAFGVGRTRRFVTNVWKILDPLLDKMFLDKNMNTAKGR